LFLRIPDGKLLRTFPGNAPENQARPLIAACAAASRAIGTRKGEQDT
jgi:hypothetical protein